MLEWPGREAGGELVRKLIIRVSPPAKLVETNKITTDFVVGV